MCGVCFSRRGALAGLMGLALAGCSENATTGRRQLVFVDDAQLVAFADQAWDQMAAKIPPVADAAVQARLARIAEPLVKASGRTDLSWSFTVLDSPEFNAFVLPNGRVGFFRGLFDFAGSDDEIGSVVGHEIGHIMARHPAERVSHELAVKAGVTLAQVAVANEAGEWTDEIGAALGLGAAFGLILPYSRRHELEADTVGVGLMRKAGMDPQAALRFWERMSQRDGGPRPPEVISTHPADGRRLEALKAAIEA
jgi:predicted Zn-dependent protease